MDNIKLMSNKEILRKQLERLSEDSETNIGSDLLMATDAIIRICNLLTLQDLDERLIQEKHLLRKRITLCALSVLSALGAFSIFLFQLIG